MNKTEKEQQQSPDTEQQQGDPQQQTDSQQPSPKTKVIFTDEQQRHLDKTVMPQRLAQFRRQVTAELTDSLTASITAELTEKLTTEISAKLQSQASQRKATPDPELVAINREIELERAKHKSILPDLQNKLRETHAVEQELATLKKQQAVIAAMGDQFHNSNLIFALVQDRIELDAGTGRYVVRGEDGRIMNDASLEPISLESFFTSFAKAEANGYLVRSGLPKGTEPGSQTTKPATREIRCKADLKTDAQRIEWIKANGLRAFEKLPLRRDDD